MNLCLEGDQRKLYGYSYFLVPQTSTKMIILPSHLAQSIQRRQSYVIWFWLQNLGDDVST